MPKLNWMDLRLTISGYDICSHPSMDGLAWRTYWCVLLPGATPGDRSAIGLTVPEMYARPTVFN